MDCEVHNTLRTLSVQRFGGPAAGPATVIRGHVVRFGNNPHDPDLVPDPLSSTLCNVTHSQCPSPCCSCSADRACTECCLEVTTVTDSGGGGGLHRNAAQRKTRRAPLLQVLCRLPSMLHPRETRRVRGVWGCCALKGSPAPERRVRIRGCFRTARAQRQLLRWLSR